jgi:hypothetical protein
VRAGGRVALAPRDDDGDDRDRYRVLLEDQRATTATHETLKLREPFELVVDRAGASRCIAE